MKNSVYINTNERENQSTTRAYMTLGPHANRLTLTRLWCYLSISSSCFLFFFILLSRPFKIELMFFLPSLLAKLDFILVWNLSSAKLDILWIKSNIF